MPRRYNVTFDGVAVTLPQDLVTVYGAAGKMLRILRCWVGATNTTAPTDQQIQLRMRYLPVTLTNGTGGTAPTPSRTDPGDAAASFTARVNDMTTKTSSSGTVVIVEANGANIKGGYDTMLPAPPYIGPSEAFVFELLSTVSGTVNLSGGVLVEEMGG